MKLRMFPMRGSSAGHVTREHQAWHGGGLWDAWTLIQTMTGLALFEPSRLSLGERFLDLLGFSYLGKVVFFDVSWV